MRRFVCSIFLATMAAAAVRAATRLPSADGQYWDVQDTSTWAQDSGGIATGGRAYPFNGFGYLKVQIRVAGGAVLARNQYVRGFGLAHDGGERFDSLTPVLVDGVVIDRGIFAPKDTNYLRYVDTFTNTSAESRVVSVAWVEVADGWTTPADYGARFGGGARLPFDYVWFTARADNVDHCARLREGRAD